MLGKKNEFSKMQSISSLIRERPDAAAHIKGSCDYPGLDGCVWFYNTSCGTLVAAEVYGLPDACGECGDKFFGFHIHEGDCCSGTKENPFQDAGGHFNPDDCNHPHHAGDLPPLMGNRGYALQIFLNGRFCVREIIGRTVIIHANPDDFTSQPSGNSGKMIACGQIRAY